MTLQTYQWVLAAHLIGVVLWVGGLFAVYWLLRIHSHAPTDVMTQLTAMELALARMMDIAAAVAIGCGVALAITGFPGNPHNWFVVDQTNTPWLHIKLVFVVVGILSVHGMMRARIKKFRNGKISPVPQWQWTVLLGSLTATILLAVTKLH
jgi:uncharacterized membrane protein